MERNVFGEPLEICCTNPMTGYYRDGSCKTDIEDTGTHTVCAIMTNEFLRFLNLPKSFTEDWVLRKLLILFWDASACCIIDVTQPTTATGQVNIVI